MTGVQTCALPICVPGAEILLTTQAVREYIEDPMKTSRIAQLISEGAAQYGMQTFDQSVMQLYSAGLINLEQALENCTNPNEFMLRIKGIHATSDRSWDAFEAPDDSDKPQAKAAVAGPDPFL